MGLDILKKLFYWFAAAIFRVGSEQYLKNVPFIQTLTIEIPIKTGVQQYFLNQYQRLDNTLLLSLTMPDTALTSYQGTPGADIDFAKNGWLVLQDTESRQVLQQVPLAVFTQDDTYTTDKSQFNTAELNWRQSYVWFPDKATIATNNGKMVYLVVKYIDYSNRKKVDTSEAQKQ
ncbi:hypothetical protein [Methylotenera sp.]|uniref:hypothetical protein n=1 Tax=Methylotenera sp. TaxID=2051956 RepID=UPI002ED9A055